MKMNKFNKEDIEQIKENIKYLRNFTFIGNNLYTLLFLKTIIRY